MAASDPVPLTIGFFLFFRKEYRIILKTSSAPVLVMESLQTGEKSICCLPPFNHPSKFKSHSRGKIIIIIIIKTNDILLEEKLKFTTVTTSCPS